jgi:cytosine/adenosine deaminase-related metal-dependent hydrolase
MSEGRHEKQIVVHGARYAKGPEASACADIWIDEGRIIGISEDVSSGPATKPSATELDLSGFLILPGLINAHDHLEFGLFPRLANPPYLNYIEWGEDIHRKFPDVIAKHRAVPKDVRLWWGGIRNLLCGATTVSHHNPLRPELQRKDFPVRVVQEYGWAHSLALGGDLRAARTATPEGRPFIVHACEGVDERAREELWGLDRLGLLDAGAVLVHGLAIDVEGLELMRKRLVSLIVCPSSNNFLFGQLPDLTLLMNGLENVTLGNDSPLTAEGDLLDEVRFAIRTCRIAPHAVYRMVTEAPAATLRLKGAEGSIKVSGVGDLIAIRDTGAAAADRLQALSMIDIELVMIGGHIQLASEEVLKRLPLPAKQGLAPLWIDGTIRWLRAPVKELLRRAEEVLGSGGVRLGGRPLRIPA